MLIITEYLCSALGLAGTMVFLYDLLPGGINARKIAVISTGLPLLVIPKHLLGWNETAFTLMGVIVFLAYFVTLFLGSQGNRLRRSIILAYFSLLLFLSGALARMLITFRYGEGFDVYAETIPLLIYGALGITVYILSGSLSVIIRRIAVTRKVRPLFLLFFILPVGQIITVYSFMFSIWTVTWIIGVLLSFVADLVLLTYTIAQEKKTELEEELRETLHQMELEQFHYREVEQRREELSKIRRDFNKQLMSVAQLVRSGEESPAQEMIRSLSEAINKTKENPYCVIPVVNAILTEKAQECAAAGIGFEVELDIPARLTMEQMHLCSIFSNLMDNAINACKQIRGEKPAIRLYSKVDGDYLFIKAVNPSAEPPKKPLSGRGYGTRILSDLAARYGGNYKSEYRDGMFTAVASFLAVDR